jgi:TolB-like protein
MRRSLLAAALVLSTTPILPAFSATNYSAPAASDASAATASSQARVLVIPFLTLNLPSDKQWIGKAVQETLIADLGRATGYSPIAFPGQIIVEDNATAVRLARELDGGAAAYAVRGSAQFVNNEVRLTAQLIDARTGDTLATSIVTGKFDDLLKLEDDLAGQLSAGPASSVPVYTSQGSGYVPRSNTVPAYSNMNQPLNYDYQDYGTPAYYYSPVYTPAYYDDSYYPSYSYGSPFVPSVFFFDVNFRNRFHDRFFNDRFHHNFFDHRGFHDGFHRFDNHFGGSFGRSFHGGSFGSGHFGGSFGGGGHFGGGSFHGGGHMSTVGTGGGFGGGHGGHH